MEYSVGFMMPNGQSSYLRYELVQPSHGEFSNTFNESRFNYKPTSYSFKLGLEYYFNPFSTKTNDYDTLRVNGPYASIEVSQEMLMLDHQDKIDIADGKKTRVEDYIIPSSNQMTGFGAGYSTSFASHHLYAGIEYDKNKHLSSKKTENRLKDIRQDRSFEVNDVTNYSALLGFRPHRSDLLFLRGGTTNTKIRHIIYKIHTH